MYEGTAESTERLGRIKKIAAVVALVLVVAAGAWFVWQQNKSLLPASVLAKITDFTPYFYSKTVPAGYTFDANKISFDAGILMVPLTSPNGQMLVLTEQSMPPKLTDKDVQQNAEPVSGTSDPATVNNIEGRMLGSMVATSRKTLILINGPGNTSKDDLIVLLQGLKPLR